MLTVDAIDAFSRSLGESDTLRARRIEAYRQLEGAGNPSGQPISLVPTPILLQGVTEGVEVVSAADPDIADRLAALVTGTDKESLAHRAFLTGFVAIRVRAGVLLSEPIRITLSSASAWQATHIVIMLERGARAAFMEELRSSAASARVSYVVDLFLADESQLEYVSLQAASPDVHLWVRQCSVLGAGASMSWRNATLGGREVDQSVRSHLQGHDATSAVEWIAYARGTEKQVLSARNIFDGRNGGGEIVMKGVAEEKGHIDCDGMIEIGLGGGGTNTYLTQEVLMLDTSARVDAVPGLEIKTNDVKASHSATVARVTEEDLFYFGARGIAKHEARGMFVRGFLGDMADRSTDTSMRDLITDAIDKKYEREGGQ